MPTARLVLVYNAGSGVFDAVAGSVHKLLSPETYACGLCYYTHGPFGMKRPFKAFLERLPCPVAFFHRDEFRRRYGEVGLVLPAVLWEAEEGRFEVLVPADALEIDPSRQEESLQTLMARIEAAVSERRSRGEADDVPGVASPDP